MLKDYNRLKELNKETIVLIKSGIFYVTYGSDALILSYLTGYKIVNNKVGFPLESLDNVLTILSNNKINTYVNNIYYEYGKEYTNYLIKISKEKNMKDKLNTLYTIIENKVMEDNSFYDKLLEFVGGFNE